MEGSSASASPAGQGLEPFAHHYFAFLSYSHDDSAEANWLHRELERFRVPSSLAGRLTGAGVIPARLTPIFRDRHELAAAHDLTAEIRQALIASRCLIVLCSPSAAKSEWTNAEIEEFRRAHPEGCVIAAIVSGEPFASEIKGRESEECFPPALRQKFDRRGRPTGRRGEPLAADLRDSGDGRRLGFLKIVAGMLGLGLDDLVQRDHLRRQRRMAGIAAGSIGGMLVAGVLAVTAVNARDEARDQRREAESLVGFMLGDLKDKLEPIGRLDALDGVGGRVLEYYSEQDPSELPDEGLAQRSKALALMGQVAQARGNLAAARAFYQEAYAGTAEGIRRNPDDPQLLYTHALNVFYLGGAARARGDLAGVERAYREYQQLAGRMVALEPDSLKWRLEEQNAEANLGIVFYQQRRFALAANQFEQALRMIEALATANPGNSEFEKSRVDSLAWLAQTRMSEGRFDEAVALRERHVVFLTRLLSRTRDVDYREKLVQSERALGNLHLVRGSPAKAKEHFDSSVSHARQLVAIEPTNREWRHLAATAQLDSASALLASGNIAQAKAEQAAACSTVSSLLSAGDKIPAWRNTLRDCQILQARIALREGDAVAAESIARESIETAKAAKSSDSWADRYKLATAYRLLGDARSNRYAGGSGRAEWQRALATLPNGVDERPAELKERATILRRLGRTDQLASVEARLEQLGYRRTE